MCARVCVHACVCVQLFVPGEHTVLVSLSSPAHSASPGERVGRVVVLTHPLCPRGHDSLLIHLFHVYLAACLLPRTSSGEGKTALPGNLICFSGEGVGKNTPNNGQ